MLFRPNPAFYVSYMGRGQNYFLHMSRLTFVYLVINYYKKRKKSRYNVVPITNIIR